MIRRNQILIERQHKKIIKHVNVELSTDHFLINAKLRTDDNVLTTKRKKRKENQSEDNGGGHEAQLSKTGIHIDRKRIRRKRHRIYNRKNVANTVCIL